MPRAHGGRVTASTPGRCRPHHDPRPASTKPLAPRALRPTLTPAPRPAHARSHLYLLRRLLTRNRRRKPPPPRSAPVLLTFGYTSCIYTPCPRRDRPEGYAQAPALRAVVNPEYHTRCVAETGEHGTVSTGARATMPRAPATGHAEATARVICACPSRRRVKANGRRVQNSRDPGRAHPTRGRAHYVQADAITRIPAEDASIASEATRKRWVRWSAPALQKQREACCTTRQDSSARRVHTAAEALQQSRSEPCNRGLHECCSTK